MMHEPNEYQEPARAEPEAPGQAGRETPHDPPADPKCGPEKDAPHDLEEVAAPEPADATAAPAQTPAPASDPCAPAHTPDPEPAGSLPAKPGPAILLTLRLEGAGGWDARMHAMLQKLVDQAEPLMGAVGKEFSSELDLSVDKYFTVCDAKASAALLEECGLTLTFSEGVVRLGGVPERGYDGDLYFSFLRAGREGDMKSFSKPLYIAADPRTLWLDLPVRDDAGYPAPDEAVEGHALAGPGKTDKVVLAASCRGRSHAHAGKPRDDGFALDHDPDSGWHFAAVADGAGSARFSRKGAALACATVIRHLRQDLAAYAGHGADAGLEEKLLAWKAASEAAGQSPEDAGPFREELQLDAIMHRAVHAAYQAIAGEAADRGATVRDYHTTLLCAAFRRFAFGWFFLFYWVGDGAMALYRSDNDILVPGAPDGGEFAGQTRFLTMMKEEINAPAIRGRTRFAFAEDFEALILMTDGITDALFPSEKAVLDADNWRVFLRETLPKGFADNPGSPRALEADLPPAERARCLREWLNFWSVGNHDDRTILMVCR